MDGAKYPFPSQGIACLSHHCVGAATLRLPKEHARVLRASYGQSCAASFSHAPVLRDHAPFLPDARRPRVSVWV